MVFSSTIIAKSGGVSLARDLAHTRPHRVQDKKQVCAFDEFAKRLKTVLASGCQVEATVDARILARSAENTGLPSQSVDLVVTSPPYANNAIDYMRAHKFLAGVARLEDRGTRRHSRPLPWPRREDAARVALPAGSSARARSNG